MQDKTPSGGLKWVKREVIAGLDRADRAIGSDDEPGEAVTALFEVRGILLALPLPAAALLAEEMQRCCEFLAGGMPDAQVPTREALRGALRLLKDYLERIEAGERDEPLRLLEPLNELRATRGGAPVRAAEVLLPASVLAQSVPLSPQTLNMLTRIARKVRPHFHRSLLRWFNDSDPEQGLLALARLFNQTRRYFKDGPVHELFLAAEGVIEGVLDETIVGDAGTKALIGRLDKILKPLVGEAPTWPDELASALLSDLLARLSQAPPGSPVIEELERAYGRRLMPGDEADSDEPQPEPAAGVATLLEAVRIELLEVTEDIRPEAAGGGQDGLLDASGRLARLGESLSLLGQGAIGMRLTRCGERLNHLAATATPGPERLVDIAGTLEHVDAELRALADLAEPSFAPVAPARQDSRTPSANSLRQTRRALAEVRAAFSDGAPEPARTEPLGKAADTLGGAARALRAAGESDAAELLAALVQQIRTRYLEAATVPGQAGMELIFRTLSAIDIHLEDRIERDQVDARMLSEAGYAIERLAALPLFDQEPHTEDPYAADSTPASELTQAVNVEFLTLFLDEAQDEIENIRIHHRRWMTDRHDEAALIALGRAFHGLKGSGGLVGARYLSALARTTAAVLDRVLDRLLPADPELLDYLADVVAALPAIVNAEADRCRPATDELLARGDALLQRDDASADSDSSTTSVPLSVPAYGATELPHGARGTSPSPRGESPDGEASDDWLQTESWRPAHRPPLDSDHLSDLAPPADGLLVETVEADSSALRPFADRPLPDDGGTGAPADEAPGDRDDNAVANGEDELPFLDDADLVGLFAEEAREILDGLDDELRDWREHGIGKDGLASARRRLHTLKGNARMAGLSPIGDLSHSLESLLQAVADDGGTAGQPLIALLQEGLDSLAAQVEAAAHDHPMRLAAELMARLERSATGGSDSAPAPATSAADVARTAPDTDAQSAADLARAAPDIDAEPAVAAPATFRASADWLDAMIGLAGEIGTYRARLLAQNTRLGLRAAQLDDALKRVKRRLERAGREVEMPVDEGARIGRRITQVQQALSDAGRIGASITDLQRETADLLRQQQRLSADLQDGLLSSRMVPFGQIEPRLHRLLRQIAPSLGKEVALVIYGGNVELDRHVLERVVAPLEHLLRNAVVHGIETPEVRRRHGKTPHGFITLGVEREGNDILCTVTDDGAGMNLVQIRAHAEARGLIPTGVVLSEDEILALTLQPGFSTAETVTQLAGRGVGLDVVSAEIAALNGDLELTSESGLGARFRIRLPLTLSIVEAMLLTAGGTLYAVPHGTALAVARVERARLTAGGDISIRYQDEDYRVLSLVSVLEARGSRCPHRPPPNRRWLPVLLVHAKEQRLALQVDSLIGSQRVMVKPIGPPLGALRWLSGGTLLPDGRVALLLDLTAVLRGGALPGSREGDGTLRMLLVNPSATATRLADALRGRTGVHLQTARGDAQVQERMQRALPDLILLDGDAPDEDAMDIAGRLRADERLQQVPILLVIGEADAALQGKALAAGIDRVLVAPVDEALLTAEVDTLLRAPRP